MASLLAVHTQYPAPEVLDAGHRLLLLDVHHPEDAVVRSTGHEMVSAQVLNAGEVGGLPLRLDIRDEVPGGVVQQLELVVGSPAGHDNLPTLPVYIDPLSGYEGSREPPDTVRSPGVPHVNIAVPAS